ncbi:hypothetical protein ACFYE2_15520 [Kocuria sp. CPCC 205300]|uniref:hypothetical protein n=1 Tax=Kocuria sabuli TaxID=3071448 RepID=UPI0036DA7F48
MSTEPSTTIRVASSLLTTWSVKDARGWTRHSCAMAAGTSRWAKPSVAATTICWDRGEAPEPREASRAPVSISARRV